MNILIFILIVLLSSVTVFASGIFTLSKSQQNRLNMVIKQLKVPAWDYKLTITSTGVIFRGYEPTIVTATWETITQEKVVEKITTVEKPVIVEKIIEKPMSQCVDLSNVKPSTGWRISTEEMKLREEIESMRLRNQMFRCP